MSMLNKIALFIFIVCMPMLAFADSNWNSMVWNVDNWYSASADTDADGIPDNEDNCPNSCNINQLDADDDNVGDVCDITPGCGGCGEIACEQSCDDIDSDGIADYMDNCPDVLNNGQEDVDNDGVGDVCDVDTIYGYISGNAQVGIYVSLYSVSCGDNVLIGNISTNTQGYYSFGDLEEGSYRVIPEHSSYVFDPESIDIDMPQAVIQAFNFLATGNVNPIWEGSEVEGTVLYGADDYTTFAWSVFTSNISFDNIEFIKVLNSTTTSADFTSNTLILKYENTSSNPNIGYPPLIYTFEFENDIISAVNLISSTFSSAIVLSYTSSSITLEVQSQNTNPGDIFTATYEIIF